MAPPNELEREPEKKRRPRAIRVLFAVLFSGILTVGGLELLLHANDDFYYRLMRSDWRSFHRRDPDLGWSLLPHAEGRIIAREAEVVTDDEADYVTIRINAQGLRNEEVGPKIDGRSRVLCLGDSFLYDAAFEQDETYVALLETELRSRGLHTELINSGVIGYGTDQELLYYRHRGHVLEPEIVLLHVFIGNDIKDNHIKGILETLGGPPPNKPFFVLQGDELVLSQWPYEGPLRTNLANAADHKRITAMWGDSVHHSLRVFELFDRGAYKALDTFGLIDPPPPARPLNPSKEKLLAMGNEFSPKLSPTFAAGVALTQALIAELHREVTEHGSRLGVVLIPAKAQVRSKTDGAYRNRTGINRALQKAVEGMGVPCLDLGASFRVAHGEGETLYGTVHWNDRGHAIAVDAAAQWLEAHFDL